MTLKPKFVTHRRAPVGAPPGTLIPDETAHPTAIRLTAISDNDIEVRENASLDDINKLMGEGRRLWIDVVGLADLGLVTAIGEMFGLNQLAVEDIANTSQRPKVEIFDEHPLVIIHMFDGKSVASKEQVSVVFDQTHVVTFQERPGDCLDPVRKRLTAPTGRIRQRGAAYLVYAILDTILDAYYPLLENIGEQLEDLEDKITTDPEPEEVTQLHRLKRELLVVKRALWPSREMLSSLTREELGIIPHDVHQFLRDTYDHAVQLIDIVETYRELATGLLDLYLSTVSTKMNEVMKVLTIISTIFIPLGFLAGIWGMNFDTASPWNMPELGLRYGYPGALILMAVIVAGLLYYFRRKKWL